jgi:C1A family cysteine protease
MGGTVVVRDAGRARLSVVAITGIVVFALTMVVLPVVRAEEPAIPPEAGQFVLGLVPSEVEVPLLDTAHLSGLRLHALPSMVDLSEHLPPVGNQGAQGSCVGWAVGYYYKSFQERMERGWSVMTPEHQFSPAFIYNQRPSSDCDRDAGMSFYSGFAILRDKGAASMAAFPYNPGDTCTQPSSAVLQDAWDYRLESFAPIYQREGTADIATLKALLAEGKPFVIAVPVYSSFYRVTASNPVLRRPSEDETFYGGHAMFVVGYDDATGGLKTVNSWGQHWGRDGYCYLAYDFVQYETWEAWTMVDHVEAPEPATLSGAVMLNGVTAPAGMTVNAWIGGAMVAQAATERRGDGSRYTLTVPADNPATPQREGGATGDRIAFTIGNVTASQTITWQPGLRVEVNLTATIPEAVPEDPGPMPEARVLWLPMTRR